ncbi:MAG: hypothetical protein ACJ71D_09095 [Nitrososphaera sp.]
MKCDFFRALLEPSKILPIFCRHYVFRQQMYASADEETKKKVAREVRKACHDVAVEKVEDLQAWLKKSKENRKRESKELT